jgi:hypothetical protein
VALPPQKFWLRLAFCELSFSAQIGERKRWTIMIVDGAVLKKSPLFPLLTSVQILLFASFCELW